LFVYICLWVYLSTSSLYTSYDFRTFTKELKLAGHCSHWGTRSGDSRPSRKSIKEPFQPRHVTQNRHSVQLFSRPHRVAMQQQEQSARKSSAIYKSTSRRQLKISSLACRAPFQGYHTHIKRRGFSRRLHAALHILYFQEHVLHEVACVRRTTGKRDKTVFCFLVSLICVDALSAETPNSWSARIMRAGPSTWLLFKKDVASSLLLLKCCWQWNYCYEHSSWQ
jgi:hypothetical protein